MSRPAEVRLLFVLSADWGELSNALYFVAGQPFRTTLLLPERLLAANPAGLPGPAAPWRSPAEVLARVDGEGPDVVLLFSAYLFTINGLIDEAAALDLLAGLRARGLARVTTDPFLGLLSRTGGSPFSDRHPRQAWLTAHFGRLAQALADVTHLYLVDAAGLTTAPSAAFFNPAIVRDGARARAGALHLAGALGVDPAARRWLYVLSAEDWSGEVARHGRAAAEALVGARLADGAAAGRQPVLVAPSPCVEAVRGRAVPGAVLLPFCGHATFMALALDAEHAFYWNVFSNSVPARAVNRLSVFFFDEGHLARAIPPLRELGLARYYPGAVLDLLDLRRPLEAAELAARAARQLEAMRLARERFQASPDPAAVIARLLGAARP